jgi:hypothetical protein
MVRESTQRWGIGLLHTTADGMDRPDLMMHYGLVPFDVNTVRASVPRRTTVFASP